MELDVIQVNKKKDFTFIYFFLDQCTGTHNFINSSGIIQNPSECKYFLYITIIKLLFY